MLPLHELISDGNHEAEISNALDVVAVQSHLSGDMSRLLCGLEFIESFDVSHHHEYTAGEHQYKRDYAQDANCIEPNKNNWEERCSVYGLPHLKIRAYSCEQALR